MLIYDYRNYKDYISDLIKTFPSNGRGLYLKLSNHLQCHTTQISQIFKGDRDLTPEQTLKVSQFFELTEIEAKYFMTLVQLERAGSFELRKFYEKELLNIEKEGRKIINRVNGKQYLSFEDQGIYYSRPEFSLVKMTIGLNGVETFGDINGLLKINEDDLYSILDFLVSTSLVIKRDDKYSVGPSKTHIDRSSPFVLNHHKNWRLKALDSQSVNDENDLFYTGPMSMSKEDAHKVKEKMNQTLKEIYEIVGPSEPDDIYCLNYDWFRLT